MNALPHNPRAIALVGMVIVFGVLTLITVVLAVLRRLDARWVVKEKGEEAIAGAPPEEATTDATTLVLISAAVAAEVRGRFMIRRVRRFAAQPFHDSAWSRQGRAVLHGSRVVIGRR